LLIDSLPNYLVLYPWKRVFKTRSQLKSNTILGKKEKRDPGD